MRLIAILLALLLALPTSMTFVNSAARGPIEITSDAEFTAENGVVGGSGTAADPYIIEGWEISAPGGVAIRITNTTKHFIIRNCTILSSNVGIELSNLRNGVVYNNTIKNSGTGIFLQNVTYVDVIENDLTVGIETGIHVKESSYVTVDGNTVDSSLLDILLEDTHYSAITDNILTRGIFNDPSYHLTVSGNTVGGKPLVYLEGASGTLIDYEFGQAIIVNSTNVRIEGNEADLLDVEGVYVGIEVLNSNGTTISYFNSTNSRYGIYMINSFQGLLVNLTISQSQDTGILLEECGNVTIADSAFKDNPIGVKLFAPAGLTSNKIAGCEFQGNGIGVDVEGDDQSTISGNTFLNNGDAIDLVGASGCTVSTNEIRQNTRGIYAEQLTDSYIFNNTIAGNVNEGLYMLSSTGNRIWNNTFLYNHQHGDYMGVRLVNSHNNIIYFNDFYDNATTDAVDNLWNSPTPLTYMVGGQYYRNHLGNFWWDYAGPDADGDYVGDVPYNVNAEQDGYPLVKRIGNYTILTGIEEINATADRMPLWEYVDIAPGMTDLSPYGRYMYAGYPNGIAKLLRGRVIADFAIPHVPEHVAPLRTEVWYSSGQMLYSTAGDVIDVGSNINDLSHGRSFIWIAADDGVKYYDARTGTMNEVRAGLGRLVDVSKYGRTWFVVDDKLVEYRRGAITEYDLPFMPTSISVGRRGVWAAFGDRLGYFNGVEWTWYNDTDATDVAAGRRIAWFVTPTGFGYVRDGMIHEFENYLGTAVEVDWRGNVYFLAPDGINVAGRRGTITRMDLDPPLVVQGYWPGFVLADWKVYMLEDGVGTAVADGSVPLIGSRSYAWTAMENRIIQIRAKDGRVTEIEVPVAEDVLGLSYSRYGLWFYTENHIGLYNIRRNEFPVLIAMPGIVDACSDRRGNFWFITDNAVGMVTGGGALSVKPLAFTPSLIAAGRLAAVWIVDDAGRLWRLSGIAYDPELVADLGAVPKDMVMDWKRNLWLAFEDLILRYDTRRGEFHSHTIGLDMLVLDWRGRVLAFTGSTVYIMDTRGRL